MCVVFLHRSSNAFLLKSLNQTERWKVYVFIYSFIHSTNEPINHNLVSLCLPSLISNFFSLWFDIPEQSLVWDFHCENSGEALPSHKRTFLMYGGRKCGKVGGNRCDNKSQSGICFWSPENWDPPSWTRKKSRQPFPRPPTSTQTLITGRPSHKEKYSDHDSLSWALPLSFYVALHPKVMPLNANKEIVGQLQTAGHFFRCPISCLCWGRESPSGRLQQPPWIWVVAPGQLSTQDNIHHTWAYGGTNEHTISLYDCCH